MLALTLLASETMRDPFAAGGIYAGDDGFAGWTVATLADALAAYGDLVHDQVTWRLRAAGSVPGTNEVADVVHDTFMIACAATCPTPPSLMRPWLLGVARNECLRMLEVPGRAPWPTAAPLPSPADLGDRGDTGPVAHPGASPGATAGPGGGLAAQQLRAMVRWAAEGLDRRDRDILELGIRHRVPPEEIALILGTGVAATSWALQELAEEFIRVLGTFLLARSRVGSCVRLLDITLRWDGAVGRDHRRRFLRHADACATCERERTQRVDALGVLRMPAVERLPQAVERWILADATDRSLDAGRAALAGRAGPWGTDGFPRALDAGFPPGNATRGSRPQRIRTALRGQ